MFCASTVSFDTISSLLSVQIFQFFSACTTQLRIITARPTSPGPLFKLCPCHALSRAPIHRALPPDTSGNAAGRGVQRLTTGHPQASPHAFDDEIVESTLALTEMAMRPARKRMCQAIMCRPDLRQGECGSQYYQHCKYVLSEKCVWYVCRGPHVSQQSRGSTRRIQ